jgi:hypothetical protein
LVIYIKEKGRTAYKSLTEKLYGKYHFKDRNWRKDNIKTDLKKGRENMGWIQRLRCGAGISSCEQQ